ncbi:MAG: FxsA family protein [Hyphomicrobium sp.]
MCSSLRGVLALLFVIFPLIEIAVLIEVGQAIGVWPTMLLLIAAAVLGATVIREQGLSVAARIFEVMREGRIPLEPMLDSYVVVMAGLLLIIPGLISDVIGLLLLIAPLRRLLIRAAVPGLYEHPLVSGRGDGRGGARRPPVIEGTFERHDPDAGDRERR